MALGPGRYAGVVRDVASTTAQRGFPSRRASGIGGTGFVPTHLPGCELWLDAADTDTITSSSGAVSQWNDKSGFGRNVSQATSAKQPGTGVQTQNELNVLTFDGGDSLVTVSGTTVAQPYTVVAVGWLRTGAATSATRLVGNRTNGNMQLIDGVALPASTGFYAGTGFATAGTSTTRQVWRIHIGVGSGTQSYAVSTGAIGALTNAGAASLELAAIGSRADDGQVNLDGRIAEVVVYSVGLSDNQRRILEQYAAAKWGITL